MTTYHNLNVLREWISERLDLIEHLWDQAVLAQGELDKVELDYAIEPVRAVRVIYIEEPLLFSTDALVYTGTDEPAMLEQKLRLVINSSGLTIWGNGQDSHSFTIELLEKPHYEEGSDA